MSTENEKWRWTYQPNGVSTSFPFDNLVLAASDLVVRGWLQNGDAMPLPAYSVTGVGNKSGGAVVFGSAPPAVTGSIIEIIRNTAKLQGRIFKDFVQETASVREQMADRAILGLQELAGGRGRMVQSSPLDPDVPVILPPTSALAGKYVYVDQTGKWTGVVPSPANAVPPDMAVVVRTWADLLAMPLRPTVVSLQGLRTAGDAGAGTFDWFPGDVSTAVFGMVGNPSIGAPGRYKRRFAPPLQPGWFGARGALPRIFRTVTIAQGGNLLNLSTAMPADAEQGHVIHVYRAGPGGRALITSITLMSADRTQLTLVGNATRALTGQTIALDYGPDDTAALNAMADYAYDQNHPVWLPPTRSGFYFVTDTIAARQSLAAATNVREAQMSSWVGDPGAMLKWSSPIGAGKRVIKFGSGDTYDQFLRKGRIQGINVDCSDVAQFGGDLPFSVDTDAKGVQVRRCDGARQ